MFRFKRLIIFQTNIIINFFNLVFVIQAEYSYTLFGIWNTFFREMIGDLGDLDDLQDEIISSPILYGFFLLATLILYITMLNLLIAIISDTFNEVKKAEKRTKIWERWNIITEIDMMLSQSETAKSENNKGYLMYIYNEKHEKDGKEKEEQHEVNKIDEKQQKSNNDYQKLSSEINDLRRMIEDIRDSIIPKA